MPGSLKHFRISLEEPWLQGLSARGCLSSKYSTFWGISASIQLCTMRWSMRRMLKSLIRDLFVEETKYSMRLGAHIAQTDERNTDAVITNLLGVSIEKRFVPSIANTVGTDLSKYKVVNPGEFAYGPVTSRNGDKVSIARLKGEKCIISSSYTSFKVVGDELSPDYLMLWFMRPEFDRYARFKSHGSAREIFDWEQLCEVDLPIPSLDKQKKIVDSYAAIENRIAALQRLNDKLAA